MENITGTNIYLRALGLGVMSGMRSLSGPLVMSYVANKKPQSFKGTWLGWLGYKQTLRLLALAQVGELVADKTPLLPSRVAPAPLLGRAQFGSFAGAAAFTEADVPASIGAAMGALGAVASSFVFFNLRRRVDRKTGLPDLVPAIAEDLLLAGLGLVVLKSYRLKP